LNLAVGKFGLRALSQCLAKEYGPQGIHVAEIITDGIVNLKTTREKRPDLVVENLISPESVADTFWFLHSQERTAWTQELDIRPSSEKW